MASRVNPLVTSEYYHVFNRGVARQPTFLSQRDYQRAILTLDYYRFCDTPFKFSRFEEVSIQEKNKLLQELRSSQNVLVDIVCFVLMPNHFHFLLRQIVEDGISKFVGQFTNSYTRYFNTKHSRPGHIFQGPFKAVHIESQEQLIHLSRYIHLNPYVSSVIKKSELPTYPWSSYPDYIKGNSNTINITSVLSTFRSAQDYQEFIMNHSDYAQQLEIVKHLTLDLD